MSSIRFEDNVLREENVQGVGEQLVRQVEEMGRADMHLDLGGVELPTAGGLGQLLRLQEELRAAGGELVVCNVNARVYEVFALAGLTDVMDVRQSEPGGGSA